MVEADADSRAIELVQQELESCSGFSDKVNLVAIRIKWGQGETKDIGTFRQFLAKYPDVFQCDGHTVKLVNPPAAVVLTTPKGKAPAPAKASQVPPLGSKAAPSSSPAVPKKRGFGDLVGSEDGQPSFVPGEPKARHVPPRESFQESEAAPQPKSKAQAVLIKKYFNASSPFDEEDNDPRPGEKGSKGSKDSKNGKDGQDGKGEKGEKGYGVQPFKGGKGAGKGAAEHPNQFSSPKAVSPSGVPQSGAPMSKAKWGGAKAPPSKARALSPQARKRALTEDSLPSDEAHRGIEDFKTNGTEIELGFLASKLVLSDEARQHSQRCLDCLRSAVSQIDGSPTVELCGSYAQGTELHGSTMEVTFQLQTGTSSEETQNTVREFLEQLRAQSDVLEVLETLGYYPHTTSPLAVDLKEVAPRFVANVLLGEQLADRSPTIDAVIKQLCDTCRPARDLIRLVKLWSVNHKLASHRGGYMNGVAWTLLVVFFLQKQKLIPPYSHLSENGPVAPTVPESALSVLLQGFFKFLQDASEMKGVSIWHGTEFSGPSSIFIEDPAHFLETRQQRSFSESVDATGWARCVEEAKKAANRIGVRPQRWFHWAEVFDPTSREPVKHIGLKKYLAGVEEEDSKGSGCGKNSSAKGGDKGKGYPPSKDAGGKGEWQGKDADGKGVPCGKDSYGKDASLAGGKGKDDSAGKGEEYFYGKGKEDPHGKGKGESYGKGKDDSFGKGKDDSFSKGKDDSSLSADDSGKGKDESLGKGKDDSYSKGGDDSYGKACGKGKEDLNGKGKHASDAKGGDEYYGKGQDNSYSKGKDDSYGKGKDDSHAKGKDDSYGKGKDYAYGKGDAYGKGKDSYGKKGFKPY